MRKNLLLILLSLILSGTITNSSETVWGEGFGDQSGVRANFRRIPADGTDETVEVGGNLLGYYKKKVIVGDRAKEVIRALERDRRGLFSVNSDASLPDNIAALSRQFVDLIEYKRGLIESFRQLRMRAEGIERDDEVLKRLLRAKERELEKFEEEKGELIEHSEQFERQVRKAKA